MIGNDASPTHATGVRVIAKYFLLTEKGPNQIKILRFPLY